MRCMASARDPVSSPTSMNRSLPMLCANSWMTEVKNRVAPGSMCLTVSTRKPSGRRLDQGGHIPADQIPDFGMPDSPLQAQTGDLEAARG
jgi:hypothetical protein